ncbi:MAG: hypothetical protein KME11_08405 [Timaviella obliquedivisa GSE-PSE-MK23-08B]|jgi:hypothetical protein|nr:hypothetical protein [Timaviella obliquedivisa GSE-PSE-MK23-08B]
MTSQPLINDRTVQFSTSAVSPSASTFASNSVSLENSQKLPYQANHQVELLHLQAETEVLLQEIQTVKQQRVSLGS